MSVLVRYRRQTTIKISHQRAVKRNSRRLSPVRGACGRGVATASMVFPAAGAILAARMRRRLLYNFPVTIAGAAARQARQSRPSGSGFLKPVDDFQQRARGIVVSVAGWIVALNSQAAQVAMALFTGGVGIGATPLGEGQRPG